MNTSTKLGMRCPDAPAHFAIRRDGGRDGDHAVARKQLADESDAADIFIAVLAAEAQAFGKMRPHDVAVEQLHLRARRAQPLA